MARDVIYITKTTRSYLVLLESFLKVSPTARPTCEKVLAALHLGKVCSLRLIVCRLFCTSS